MLIKEDRRRYLEDTWVMMQGVQLVFIIIIKQARLHLCTGHYAHLDIDKARAQSIKSSIN